MNELSKFIKLVLLVCFYSGSAYGQSVTVTAGGNAIGSGGSVSYSVGQILCNTISGSNGIIIQGVQQPYEISIVTGIGEKNIDLSFKVYPNPATDFLILKVENYDTENLSYWLYDINGNIIENKKVIGNETQIIMQNIMHGTYFLKVTLGNKDIKTFKIIKN